MRGVVVPAGCHCILVPVLLAGAHDASTIEGLALLLRSTFEFIGAPRECCTVGASSLLMEQAAAS